MLKDEFNNFSICKTSNPRVGLKLDNACIFPFVCRDNTSNSSSSISSQTEWNQCLHISHSIPLWSAVTFSLHTLHLSLMFLISAFLFLSDFLISLCDPFLVDECDAIIHTSNYFLYQFWIDRINNRIMLVACTNLTTSPDLFVWWANSPVQDTQRARPVSVKYSTQLN